MRTKGKSVSQLVSGVKSVKPGSSADINTGATKFSSVPTSITHRIERLGRFERLVPIEQPKQQSDFQI
jgi:hypothetical protein